MILQRLSQKPLGEVLALCAGAAFPLGFAPFEWRPVSWLSLFVLFALWTQLSAKRAFWLGWLWGLSAFLVGVYWVYNSMHNFGGAPPAAAALFTLLFAMYLALYPALAGGLWRKLFAGQKGWLMAASLGLIWPITEWLRAWVLTGFPWLMSGYTLLDTPLDGYMTVVGSLGSSVFAAFVMALFAILVTCQNKKNLSFSILALLVVWIGGIVLDQLTSHDDSDAKTLDVALVQGNVPQEIKLRAEYLNVSLEAYYELSKPHFDADLIIWPETAMPTYRYALQGFLNKMAKETADQPATVYTGVFSRAENGRDYYNAMLEIGGQWQEYRKHQLVPFGEYMPIRWLMKLFSAFVKIPKSDMASAHQADQPMELAGVKVATSICYEMAYPDVLRTQLDGADLMVNTSNDAWFGDSLAAHQHLEMARVRAREFAMPIARATNNGITAFIDETGEVIAKTKQFEANVLRGRVYLISSRNMSWFINIGQNVTGLSLLALTVLLSILDIRFFRR